MDSQSQEDFDDTWAGLVPEQPDHNNPWPKWILMAVAGLIIICLCGFGTYWLVREFVLEPPPTAIVEVPTLEITTPETAPSSDTPTVESAEPTDTPSLVPTVTVVEEPTTEPTEQPIQLTDIEAVRLAVPPIIDGVLDEWGAAPTFQSNHIVYTIDGWDGTDDLVALWRLAWDSSNLYIGVEVNDDIHVQTQTGQLIFRGDSLDMQFDTDRDGDFAPRLSPDDFQIIYSPGDFGALPPSAVRFRGSEEGQIPEFPGHGITLQSRATTNGYILEAAIPWSDINLNPAEGIVIGLALNANDNDSSGTAAQEVMKSHIASRTLTDPTSWGTLTLR